MAEVVLSLVPLAAVIAINPIPVIAVIVILQAPRGRLMGSMFIGSWLVALLLLGGVAIAAANRTDLYGSGSSSVVARVIRGLVAVLLLYLAARKWWGRPRQGEEATAPKWMERLSSTTPARSARLGALLAGGNPKNIAVTLAAAAAIVEVGLPVSDEIVVLVLFVLTSTVAVAAPVAVALAMGSRGEQVLAGWGRWLGRHNAVVMSTVLLVIGVLLLLSAVRG